MNMELRIKPITAAQFAPYGWLISAQDIQGRQSGRPINDGTSLRFDDFGKLSLDQSGGEPCMALFRASARNIRGPWQTLERHRLGTQSFIPLANARYVLLVALGNDAPDPDTLAAFSVTGHQGVTLHAGTWHHGLLAIDDGDFVVIERYAEEVDCDIERLNHAVTLIAE